HTMFMASPPSLLGPRPPPALHSFPTRRSSDLCQRSFANAVIAFSIEGSSPDSQPHGAPPPRRPIPALGRQLPRRELLEPRRWSGDRKSTRLNSSHQIISYAVFCLKKKNNQDPN